LALVGFRLILLLYYSNEKENRLLDILVFALPTSRLSPTTIIVVVVVALVRSQPTVVIDFLAASIVAAHFNFVNVVQRRERHA
jgi:hypothetical protein